MEVKQDLPGKTTFGQIPMIRNEPCEERREWRGEPGRGKNVQRPWGGKDFRVFEIRKKLIC